MTTVRRTTAGSLPVAPPPPAATLRQGSHGAAVTDLQRKLAAAGFDPGAADGDFGPRTRRAVEAFQRARGLEVDGVVGPQTRAALEAASTTPSTTTPSAGTLAETGPVLRQGSRGDEVAVAQRALAAAGFDPGPVDGVFGGQTRSAVLAFQRSRSLPQNGKIDAATRQALANPDDFQPNTDPNTTPGTTTPGAVGLAPRSMSEREKFDYYASIVRAQGGQVNPNGQATVLGLRGVNIDGEKHGLTSARAYDDVFVVLGADGRVTELPGATHPGQNSSTASPDVTGDRVGDVGTIRPGNYSCVPNGNHGGNQSWHVRTTGGSGTLPGWRDTNHDGRFTDAERAASESRGDTLTAVLFHQGNSTTPSSIGCQTLSPSDYTRLIAAVGGRNSGFSFTLVDASR